MQIPEAAQACNALIIGFADMFLPSILIEGVQMHTSFVIGTSILQSIILVEVGGVILGSKIPGHLQLFMIFLLEQSLHYQLFL